MSGVLTMKNFASLTSAPSLWFSSSCVLSLEETEKFMVEAEGKAALPLPNAYLAKRQKGKLTDSIPDGQPRQLRNQPPPDQCPQCGSSKLYRDGFRTLNDDSSVQRWLWRSCGFRFSEKPSIEHPTSIGNGQVCVTWPGAKNLTSATIEKVAGKTTESKLARRRIEHTLAENEIKASPAIEKLLAQLKGDGRTEGTVLNYRKTFKCLLKANADLFDPENTKLVLADLKREDGTPTGNNTKKTMAAILDVWYDFNGIKWKSPRYVKVSKPVYVPSTGLLQQFTAAFGKIMCCFCMLLMETGARCGEIANLEMKDFDFEQQRVSITPEKGSNPRTLRIMHPQALEMVKKLPKNKNPLRKNKLFAAADDMRSNFYVQRRRAARKFQNPDMLKIHFHTYRHWKATTAQRMLKDIFAVQTILGHRNCESTRKYIDLAKAYGDVTQDEYETRVADTMEEAQKLIEVGFEYHMEIEGHKLLRRKKAYNGLSW